MRRLHSIPGQVFKRGPSGVCGMTTKFILNTHQLVVLGHPVGTRQRTGLDLGCRRGNRDIGYGHIFRFTRAM